MEGVKDLEAEALSGDPKAQALLHFLRLLRRKDYAGARAYAGGFPFWRRTPRPWTTPSSPPRRRWSWG